VWGQRLSQLTERQRQDVWLRSDEGASMTELSKRFGVSVATISRICSDRRQRRNVIAVLDETPRSEQSEKQCEASPRQSRQDEAVSLAEGRERKPGRAAAKASRN
jgi:transposase